MHNTFVKTSESRNKAWDENKKTSILKTCHFAKHRHLSVEITHTKTFETMIGVEIDTFKITHQLQKMSQLGTTKLGQTTVTEFDIQKIDKTIKCFQISPI